MTLRHKENLPDTRGGLTRRFTACGFKIFMTVNFYENTNDPCEVFTRVAKEGSTLGGLITVVSILISYSLRLGGSWDLVKEALTNQSFEPRDDEYSSIVDALAQQIDDIIREKKALWGEEDE